MSRILRSVGAVMCAMLVAMSANASAQEPSPDEIAAAIETLPESLKGAFRATFEKEKDVRSAAQSGNPEQMRKAEMAMANSIIGTLERTKAFLKTASPDDAEKVRVVLSKISGGGDGDAAALCERMLQEARMHRQQPGGRQRGGQGQQPPMHDPNMGGQHNPNQPPPMHDPNMGGRHDPNQPPPTHDPNKRGQHNPNQRPPMHDPSMGGQHDPNQPPMHDPKAGGQPMHGGPMGGGQGMHGQQGGPMGGPGHQPTEEDLKKMFEHWKQSPEAKDLDGDGDIDGDDFKKFMDDHMKAGPMGGPGGPMHDPAAGGRTGPMGGPGGQHPQGGRPMHGGPMGGPGMHGQQGGPMGGPGHQPTEEDLKRMFERWKQSPEAKDLDGDGDVDGDDFRKFMESRMMGGPGGQHPQGGQPMHGDPMGGPGMHGQQGGPMGGPGHQPTEEDLKKMFERWKQSPEAKDLDGDGDVDGDDFKKFMESRMMGGPGGQHPQGGQPMHGDPMGGPGMHGQHGGPMGGPGMQGHQDGPENPEAFAAEAEERIKTLPRPLQAGYRQTLEKWKEAHKARTMAQSQEEWKKAAEIEIKFQESVIDLMNGTKQFLSVASEEDQALVADVLLFFDGPDHAQGDPAGMKDAGMLADKAIKEAHQDIDRIRKEIEQGGPMHGGMDGGDPGMGHPGQHGMGSMGGPGQGQHGMQKRPDGAMPGNPETGPMHGTPGAMGPQGGPGKGRGPMSGGPMHGGPGSGPMSGRPGKGAMGGGAMDAPEGMSLPPECSDAVRDSELLPQGTVSVDGGEGNLLFRTVCSNSPYDTNAISLPSGRTASSFDVEAATPGRIFFGIRVEGGANVWTTADGKDAFHALSLGEGVYQIFLDASQSDPGARVTVRFVDHP